MNYLNIAIAKGRLVKNSYKKFKEIGLDCSELEKDTRKLIFVNEHSKIRFILVKSTDVPIYVERGAADIGIVGKDTIIEEDRDVYEIADLGFGKCCFVVAAPSGYKLDSSKGKLRVATKYPKVAEEYFASKNITIDVIKLNGSIELAPLVGLSDVIVDIVESGRTLKENGLAVVENILQLSARIIANKVSFKTKNARIKKIVEDLNKVKES